MLNLWRIRLKNDGFMKIICVFSSSVRSLVRFTMLAICLIYCVPSAMADNVSYRLADSLYMKGKYSEASDAYLSIAKIDGVSAGLYYNLANSYAQIGDLGKAILYYSRANRLDPSNKQIGNNLSYFISKVEDSNRAELRGKKISVSRDPETFFQTVDRLICADVSSNVWAVAAAIAFILLLCEIAIYLFCNDVKLRKAGFFGGICAFFLSIIFVVFAFKSASYYDSRDEAVLMTYKTELLIEPSSDAKPASSQLCQGTRFDVVSEETDVQGNPTWYKVRLNANIEGWLRASDVEII